MKVTKTEYKGYTIIYRVLKKQKFDIPHKPIFEIWKNEDQYPSADSFENAIQLINDVTQ